MEVDMIWQRYHIIHHAIIWIIIYHTVVCICHPFFCRQSSAISFHPVASTICGGVFLSCGEEWWRYDGWGWTEEWNGHHRTCIGLHNECILVVEYRHPLHTPWRIEEIAHNSGYLCIPHHVIP